jgi:hypothetical protein
MQVTARVPHPWLFAVLYFPTGLMIGYPSVALGYLGHRARSEPRRHLRRVRDGRVDVAQHDAAHVAAPAAGSSRAISSGRRRVVGWVSGSCTRCRNRGWRVQRSPRTSLGYAAGTLFYTFTLGRCAATLTGMVLSIIGEGAAATKINLFFALNTLFSIGVLRLEGWVHDRWATNGMLVTEFAIAAVALMVFLLLVSRIRGAELAPRVSPSGLA